MYQTFGFRECQHVTGHDDIDIRATGILLTQYRAFNRHRIRPPALHRCWRAQRRRRRRQRRRRRSTVDRHNGQESPFQESPWAGPMRFLMVARETLGFGAKLTF